MSIKSFLSKISFLRYLWSCYRNAKDIERMYVWGVGGNCLILNMLDMVYCQLLYGASSDDYKLFEFFRLRHRECAKFETKERHKKLVKQIQKTFAKEGCLEDKDFEYDKYKKFIHRKWMIIDSKTSRSEVIEFVKECGWVIAKPVGTGCGYGIKKFNSDQTEQIDVVLSGVGRSKYENKYIIEECVENASFLSEINPTSLNTFRIFTATDNKGQTQILEVMLRVGKPDMFVDNWSAGGVLYKVDIETGIVIQPGIDKDKNRYISHPGSGIKMVGYQIPEFDLLKQTVYNLVAEDKRVSIVGWDLTFTKKGVEFIEMNSPGGHDILQSWGTPYWGLLKKYVYG